VASNFKGRAIAQASSCRLPTEAALVRSQVMSCGTSDGLSDNGVAILEVFRFPLPILIPPTALESSLSSFLSIIWDWYNRPNSGRRTKWTQFHPTPKKFKKIYITLKFVMLAAMFALPGLDEYW
jgi:hypothetical protein